MALTGFGVVAGGTRLFVPSGTTIEFLHGARVVPLPLAPAHVRGLTQLRGLAMPVMDLGAARGTLPVLEALDLVAVQAAEIPGALVVDRAPVALQVNAFDPGTLPDELAWLAGAVDAGTLDDEGQTWWSLNFPRLFECLCHER